MDDPYKSTLGQQGKDPSRRHSRRGFARAFIETAPISAKDKSKMAHLNLERLLLARAQSPAATPGPSRANATAGSGRMRHFEMRYDSQERLTGSPRIETVMVSFPSTPLRSELDQFQPKGKRKTIRNGCRPPRAQFSSVQLFPDPAQPSELTASGDANGRDSRTQGNHDWLAQFWQGRRLFARLPESLKFIVPSIPSIWPTILPGGKTSGTSSRATPIRLSAIP